MRVGFSVPQSLRLFQRRGEIEVGVAHPAQDVIAGAVDDAGNGTEAVGDKAFLEGTDDRYAAADAGLEADVALRRGCGLEEFLPMLGQQRLVGRHHVLAGPQGFEQIGARRLVAAHQFDHDVDFRIVDDGQGIAGDLCRRQRRIARAFGVPPRGAFQHQARAQPPRNQFGRLLRQDGGHATADVAEADESYLNGLHGFPVSRSGYNSVRSPRRAWRVRWAFSTSAKRT